MGGLGLGGNSLYQNADEVGLLFILVPLGMLLIVAALLCVFPQVWTRTVGGEDARRNHTMDGARGLLSLWVLTHHLNALPFLLQPGLKWEIPQSAVTMLMGSSFFTAPFYALTAMLFGGALLASGGELRALAFLRNRFFRLTPVYVLSLALVVAVAFYLTDFRLQVPAWKLVKELVRWGSFGTLRMYDINGADVAGWHGMLWTLPYEIAFYLMLPVLAWGQRKLKSPLVLIAGLAAAALFSWQFIFFTAGVVAAAALGWRHRFAPAIWSGLAVAALVVLSATAAWSGPITQAILLIPMLVAAGLQVPMLAPFRWRPIRFVGEISYSVYILHYPLICIFLTLAVAPATVNAMGYAERAGALALFGSAVIALSALSYVFVERPVIDWGKRQRRPTFASRLWTAPHRAGRSPAGDQANATRAA